MRAVCWHGKGDVRVDTFPDPERIAAENASIRPGHVVAVWGCGPVGQFAIKSAYLLGAERVIGIDCVPERLRLARETLGAAFAKGLTLRMGQTHAHRYMRPLMQRIEVGDIDPTFVISHRLSPEDAPEAYHTFREKQDGCTKVVLRP